MYLLDIGHDVIAALRSLMFSIFESLLRAILSIYNIFMAVAEHELFNDDTIQLIYTRVGLILGLFMVFRLTFSAIEYLINPDTMNDKQKGIGNVIKKVLIVVILLGSVNALFDQAYNIQKIVLKNEDNLISKIILGPSENKDAEENESGEGVALVWTIFKSFYVPIDGVGDTCKNTINDDGTVKPYLYDKPVPTNAFDIANECITKESGESWVIQFDWLFGIATAIFILWTLLIYTIQVGVRCIQLAYLELIAPIPIMMYLNPKGDDTLKKWGTQCLITYIDVFIRMAILYFIILIIRTIEESNLFDGGGFSVGIVLLLALFLFVKKVPELIKEIFPSIGGKASLDFGMKVKEGLTLGTGMALGAVGGAATGIKYGKGTAGGRLGGALTGLARGTVGGAKTKGNILANAGKGMSSQRAAMQRAYNRNNDGSDFWGRTLGAGDAAKTKAAFDEELSFYDAYTKNADLVDSELAKNASVKAILAEQQALMSRGESGGPIPTAAEIASMDSRVKAVKQTALQNEMNRRGTADENKVLIAALDNAEAMRKKAVKSNYAGFEKYHETSVLDYSDNFLDSVKEVKNETRNIKDPSGSRNEAYKKAEANAKYARDK